MPPTSFDRLMDVSGRLATFLFEGERECADTAVQPQPNVCVFDEMEMMRRLCRLVTAH
jgi:hypothetical protein